MVTSKICWLSKASLIVQIAKGIYIELTIFTKEWWICSIWRIKLRRPSKCKTLTESQNILEQWYQPSVYSRDEFGHKDHHRWDTR